MRKYTLIFLCVLLFKISADPLILAAFEYPPYITQSGDSITGLTFDIVKEIFKRMEVEIKIEFYPFARSLALVKSGQVDGLFTIKKTPERERILLYPKETLISQDYVFFVLKHSNTEFNGDFKSLSTSSIGVVPFTSYGLRFDNAAKNQEFGSLDFANNYELNFKKLLSERVDTVICSRLVGLSILKKLEVINIVKITGPSSETAESYLIFTKQKELSDIADLYDKVVSEMKRDGTMQELLDSYKIK